MSTYINKPVRVEAFQWKKEKMPEWFRILGYRTYGDNIDIKVGLTVREFYRKRFKLEIYEKVDSSFFFRLTLPYRNKVTVSVGFYKEYPVLEKLNSLVHEYWNKNNNASLLIDEEYQLYFSRQLGTVKPNDKYEIMNGWTLSKKELYALEYDSDKLVAEWHV